MASRGSIHACGNPALQTEEIINDSEEMPQVDGAKISVQFSSDANRLKPKIGINFKARKAMYFFFSTQGTLFHSTFYSTS